MMKKTFKIIDEAGMHARPASKLVQTASSFDADLTISYKGKDVDLKSVMGVMSLGVPQNGEITIEVDADDEKNILTTLEEKLRELALID